ncbi:F-box protein [Senna tora]|uniref:F-box protein n=1 Tax=Senna tora TaxID=362788 RepID=A0A834U2G9_9FABA|nr:F-box protein [Senna tora]
MSSPWVVHRNGEEHIFYSLSHPKKIYRKKIPPSFGDSVVVAHCGDWFLFSQRDTHFSLWNPTISDSFIRLPPLSLKPNQKITHYLLSSPPGDPDCKVLLFNYGSIIVIRPDAPHKEWTHIQTEDRLRGYKDLNLLNEVHVFKLDFDGMSWKRAESLMGHTVFFNAEEAASSFNPAFGKGIEADSIYFTLPKEKGLLYSFNVTDGCLSVTLPCPTVPSHWSSPMILMPHDVRSEQGKRFDEKEDRSSARIVRVGETSFLDLPLECQEMIADCLNLFDRRSFRATCRDFRLIPKLQHRQALQRFKSCASSSTMWLLLSVNDMTAFKFVDPVHGTSFLMSVPESLKGSVVRYSSNGWLLMSDGKSSMSFLNPFTEEIIKLPLTEQCASSYAMAFTSLPTFPNCTVVDCGASPPTATGSKLSILLTTTPDNWVDGSIENNAIFRINNSSPVFYKESFYLLGLDGKLSVLKCVDLEDDLGFYWTIVWDILERLETPYKSFYQNFLLECDGKLMSIFVGEMGKWLQIYSLNFTEMRWEKVESIGNYVIYVSRSSSIAIEASIMGTVESFYNTKEPLLATWIEPLCSSFI